VQVVAASATLERSLWLDEAYSALLARRAWPDLLASLEHDNNPFLHYLLLRGWRALFGESEPALRSLSLALALGCTLLLYRFAHRAFGAGTARWAAALWALNPLAVFYAGEARAYMLLAFCALMFLTALWEPAAPRGRARWVVLAGSLAALLYAHNTGWFVAAAALLAAVAVRPRSVLRGPVIASFGAGALAYVPWIPMLLRQLEVAGLSSGWLQFYWSPWNPIFGLSAFTPFGREAAFVDMAATPPPWWVVGLVLWLLPVGWLLVRPGTERTAPGRYLAVHVGVGLLLLVVASVALRPVYLPGRHDFVFLAPFLVLVAAGVTTLPARARGAYGAVLLALSIAGTAVMQLAPTEAGDRVWAGAVGRFGRAGDVVLCAGLTRPQAEYYLTGRGFRFVSFPSAMERQLAHLDFRWTAASLRTDAEEVVARAVAALPPGGNLWLIDSLTGGDDALREAFARRPDLAAEPIPMGPVSLDRIGARVAIVRYHRAPEGG
jgi:4-amino-4-deoxy-L-arabinose transferase-like glycosyltransferase